jgi:hypothetical protein
MSTEQPKQDVGQKIFKVLLVIAVVMAILTSGMLCIGSTHSAPNSDLLITFPYHQEVISGPLVLNPNGYYLTGFLVPEGAKTSTLQGNFAVSNSSNNGVIITVWSQKEFINYFSCHNAVAFYNQYMVPATSGEINLELASGQYLILFSGASVNLTTVQTQLDLNCT